MKIQVQLDGSEKLVVSYFGSAQDAENYPGQVVIESSDVRWHEYYSRVGGLSLGLPAPPTDEGAG